jgi:hypothetical protein
MPHNTSLLPSRMARLHRPHFWPGSVETPLAIRTAQGWTCFQNHVQLDLSLRE